MAFNILASTSLNDNYECGVCAPRLAWYVPISFMEKICDHDLLLRPKKIE